MKKAPFLSVPLLVTLAAAPCPCGAEEFLLYTPKPAAGEQVPASPEQGVLVKTVTVQRGDTLAGLSRKHLGKASRFPQVLLFNSIRNPDLIHPGERLLVPVPPGRATAGKKGAGKKGGHAARRQFRHRRAAPGQGTGNSAAAGEQESYRRARRAYAGAEYQEALGLFTAFLRDYPDSRLAADAALYRADCFLRLSGG